MNVEVSQQNILNFEARLATAPNYVDEHTLLSNLGYRQDILNQTLHLNALVLLLGGKLEKGGTARLGLSYDWFDGSSIGGGFLVYQKGADSECHTGFTRLCTSDIKKRPGFPGNQLLLLKK